MDPQGGLRQKFQSTHPHGVRLQHANLGAVAGPFQSTHPHGVRLYTEFPPAPYNSFNPRTHTGCDAWTVHRISLFLSFQSTHPHGVRHEPILRKLIKVMFQSTHPHGVRPQTLNTAAFARLFQSTHPHGVRLIWFVTFVLQRYVSIHAPTRGATQRKCPWRPRCASFNPRTHTGCDKIPGTSTTNREVSIHAPTRGATNRSKEDEQLQEFQSTHPHGVRRGDGDNRKAHTMFQSTHPHGVRQCRSLNWVLSMFVSIHAPTRGATYQHTNLQK